MPSQFLPAGLNRLKSLAKASFCHPLPTLLCRCPQDVGLGTSAQLVTRLGRCPQDVGLGTSAQLVTRLGRYPQDVGLGDQTGQISADCVTGYSNWWGLVTSVVHLLSLQPSVTDLAVSRSAAGGGQCEVLSTDLT